MVPPRKGEMGLPGTKIYISREPIKVMWASLGLCLAELLWLIIKFYGQVKPFLQLNPPVPLRAQGMQGNGTVHFVISLAK